jgi:hypothetical protein
MNHISRLIAAEAPDATGVKALPLVHTTSAYQLRTMMSGGGVVIRPQPDAVFNESLLYFFYGKPVYYQRGEGFSSFSFYQPVYFLMAPSSVSAAHRVFPFDSGAFSAGLFANYVSKRHTLSDFELDLDSTSHGAVVFPQVASRFVKAIYGSNRNYFYNKVRSDLKYDPINFEIDVYLNLTSSKETARFDERHAALEIQTSKEIIVDQSTCLAIILPDSLLDSALVQSFLSANPKIVVKSFAAYRSAPEYFSSLSLSLVGDYLETNGYFS